MVLNRLKLSDSEVIFFLMGVFLMSFVVLLISNSGSEMVELPYGRASHEVLSPADHLKESDIHVYSSRIVIDGDFEWARFTDTNSMDPVLDIGANAIQVVPKSESDIELGDIVTYEVEGSFIIHRVIDISKDEYGTYYTLKGDNNENSDPYRVRFSDVRKVLVGILY